MELRNSIWTTMDTKGNNCTSLGEKKKKIACMVPRVISRNNRLCIGWKYRGKSIDRFLPVLSQQHIYAGDAPLMSAVLLRRILLSDAHGSQRDEKQPYHQEATTGGDQCRRILRGFRARSELNQTDNQHHRSQQQRADDDVQGIYLE